MNHLIEFKLYENVQQAKSILAKNGLTESDPSYIKIRSLLRGHEGYVGMFANLLYNKGYTIDNLSNLYTYIKDNDVYIKRFTDNITTYDNIEKIQDTVEQLKLSSKIRKIYNEFPSLQKSMIKFNTKKWAGLLSRLADRKDNKAFFRKVASYKTILELSRGIEAFLSVDPTSSMERIINDSLKTGSKIKYKSFDDQILIVEVFDVQGLQYIAGDCSWCIKDKYTFDSYLNNTSDSTSQYVIFLFDIDDDDRKIGATFQFTRPNSFNTAHNKVDSYIPYNKLDKILSDHGYDINKLKPDIDNIDFNLINVAKLLEYKTKEYIVSKKDVFLPKDIKSFTDDEIKKYKLLDRIDFNKNYTKELIDSGISKDEIAKRKTFFKLAELGSFTDDEIKKYGIDEKCELSGSRLGELYKLEEVINGNLLNRLSTIFVSDIVSLYCKYGLKWINYIKKLYNDDDKLLMSIIDKESKSFIKNIKKPTNGPYGFFEKRSIGDDSVFNNVLNLVWFIDYVKTILNADDKIDKRLISLFDRDELKYSIRLYNDLGYDISSTSTYEYLFSKYRRPDDACLAAIEYCNIVGYDPKEYKNILYKLLTNHTPESYNMSKFKSVLPDDKWEELLKVFKYKEFITTITRARPYNNNKSKSEKIYNDWNDYITGLKLPYSYSDNLSSNIIITYLLADKLDELNCKMNISKSDISELDKIISGNYLTNGGIRPSLTDEQCKELYSWLVKNDGVLYDLNKVIYQNYSDGNDGAIKVKEHEDKRVYLQRSIFLYDKKSYNEYLEYVKKLKYNVARKSFSSGGGIPELFIKSPKNTTNRIYEITNIISLFENDKENKYLEDYKSLINDMVNNWNLSLTEVKTLLDITNIEEIRKVLIDKLKTLTKSDSVLKQHPLKRGSNYRRY